MCLLSIIVPFYNSEYKCDRLLKTISTMKSIREFLFIDDGSVDGTLKVLREFKQKSNLQIQIYHQENKGPGGARNLGLNLADGKYVWFVDSDDDIRVEVIDKLKKVEFENFDFIDFNLCDNRGTVNSMKIHPGIYADPCMVKEVLLNNFGRICTKIIRRKLILDNNILYPEYCIYEDNSLIFILPFYIKRFYKSDTVGYVHQEEHESVTRSEPGPRYFDRMYTATYGLNKGLNLTINRKEQQALYEKFITLFLVNTAKEFLRRLPAHGCIISLRIMRRYREVASDFDVRISPFSMISGNLRLKILFGFFWFSSYLCGRGEAF